MSASTIQTNHGIPGAGIDASPERRPGIPMEADPPRPVGEAHWQEPAKQHDPGKILKRKGLAELTPVFGNTIPPRGLSGLMRRAAYEIPEHHTAHWMILLLADRVDALEYRASRVLPIALPLAAVGGIALAIASRRRPRRSRLLGWLG